MSSTSARLATALFAVAALTGIGAQPVAADPVADAIPAGVEASFLVFDRATGDSGVQFGAHKQYRSASVVKLLIALDYLESHDPQSIPADDLARLQAMLRSSDDDAASYLWVVGGWDEIVKRTAAKLGLADTAPPASRGMWGYTAISAADVVTVYRYILDKANPAVRQFIMSNLHEATKCAQDGFDQYFGIPRAFDRPWAVKQGWSGFGDAPDGACTPEAPSPRIPHDVIRRSTDGPFTLSPDGIVESAPTRRSAPGDAPAIDLKKRAMHTTGTVGIQDKKIVVVLTLEPTDTSWEVSAQRITLLTKAVGHAAPDARSGTGNR
ncbi:class A beta-lactamase-related serine hydrolase [Nocardia sp. CDC159]|uniref:Class A beta-lactamase-related serine hydrolase n=1 Tax=Nocardia pulmonis TaxID=2951408 RepID=A0A9X2E4W8_9NOCA|nr:MULTISPECIES: class A beta-lactamase-related serine hydrolase [Nocardia]MCM6774212.1 class A beta-lactamase-related serine hydrolase [Nocardia pulmonis]MCM6787099.1 class A beta-lactamase-related serine hydrolase [Nocardia sp. CDC159]